MTPEDIARLPYRRNVGVMLVNADGQVWVGQRMDYDGDAWQMPQGGIDEGEDARTAALRELEEETGITPALVTIEAETEGWHRYDLPHDLVSRLWKGRYRGQEQKWFMMRFTGDASDIDIATEHPEFSEWKWIDPAEMLDVIVPFKRAVYAAVLDELGDRLRPLA